MYYCSDYVDHSAICRGQQLSYHYLAIYVSIVRFRFQCSTVYSAHVEALCDEALSKDRCIVVPNFFGCGTSCLLILVDSDRLENNVNQKVFSHRKIYFSTYKYIQVAS